MQIPACNVLLGSTSGPRRISDPNLLIQDAAGRGEEEIRCDKRHQHAAVAALVCQRPANRQGTPDRTSEAGSCCLRLGTTRLCRAVKLASFWDSLGSLCKSLCNNVGQ